VAALNHPTSLPSTISATATSSANFVDGEPLRGGKPGLRRTIEIACRIAAGLRPPRCRHVHRDSSPTTSADERRAAEDIGFGLAKMQPTRVAAEGETVTVRTEAGVVMGTPGYMSPEQVRGLPPIIAATSSASA